MDLPKQPEDPELKNIIDKLANFVARNGPEFEFMTKQKQKDNPKFSFLFGGELYQYYQFKVNSERGRHAGSTILPSTPTQSQKLVQHQQQKLAQQHVMVQQAITQQAIQTAPWQQNQQLQQQIQQLQQQIQQQQQRMQEQVKQSEQNLAAQYQSLIQQQQVQIEEAILKARDERLRALSDEGGISIEDLDKIVQPIIESCTKDAISNGKSWIFTRSIGDKQCELVTQYLLKRITARDSSFQMRLHLIYLVNDLLHHCQRKNAEELKHALEKMVVPVFCTASSGVEEEKRQKLTKLLNLWDQNKYFSPLTISNMKDSAAGLASYQASLITDHAHIVTQITGAVQQQYAQLQKQHQEYAAHLNSQLQPLQQQLQLLQQQGPPPGASGAVALAQTSVVQPAIVTAIPTSGAIPPGVGQPTLVVQAAPAAMPLVTTVVTSQANGSLAQIPQPVVSTVLSEVQAQSSPARFGPPTSSAVAIPVIASSVPVTVSIVTLESTGSPIPSLAAPALGPAITNLPPPTAGQPSLVPSFGQQPPPGLPTAGPVPQFPPSFGTPPPGFPPPYSRPPPYDYGLGPRGAAGPPPDFSTPPPGIQLPDLSKPPPGFPLAAPPAPAAPEVDLTPSVPYYELPAGLMAPLVKLEDGEYRSLNPKDIRLPPPAPPSERLLAAVEAFYSAPSHERPRDSEGWEKLGLYEFFKAKQKAKKIRDRERELMPRGRSPSISPPPPVERPRSRSRSPLRRRRRYNSGRRSLSRSRSRSKSKSPLPYQRTSRSPSPSPAAPASPRRRPRSRSRSISPMPASMASFADPVPAVSSTSKLGEDNKGHQLLMKMGWSGKGLGATEQGIVEPISGGEVRDRQDMFKGIGIDLKDPFEQFRKSKSQGYVQRMRARDDGTGAKETPSKKTEEKKSPS